MGDVVSLAEHRPHWTGEAICIGCNHVWTAVAPTGVYWLECPQCHMQKGVPRYPFEAKEGDAVLECNCGSQVTFIYKRNGLTVVRCMKCGNDLTDAAFE